MSINQFSGLYIVTVMAVFALTVTATISVTPAAIAQNMTGAGNMTGEGTNMTDMNATGSISQVAPESEQEGEGETDTSFNIGGDGGNTGSDGEVENKPGEGPRLDFGDNQQGNSDSDEDDDDN
jgi:hypothetical protein